MLRVARRLSSHAPAWLGERHRRSGHELVFRQHGDPNRVLELVPSAPVGAPGEHEIVVRFLAAPINPADVNVVEGVYAKLPTALPAVGGNEGVAVVMQAGPGVDASDMQIGDWVLPNGPLFGTWRSGPVLGPAQLFSRIARDIPLTAAATLTVNPATALRMLSDFVPLQPGDVVIQNGANSAVGLCVVQLARARGLKSINIIRDRPDLDVVKRRLESLGANVVLTESQADGDTYKAATAGLARPRLALNCVGGRATITLAKALGSSGKLVTYGGMSKRPVTLPAGLQIFRDVSAHGFWMTRWYETHSQAERRAMFDELAQHIRSGALSLPVKEFPFSDYKSAVAEATREFKPQKVLLVM